MTSSAVHMLGLELAAMRLSLALALFCIVSTAIDAGCARLNRRAAK